MQEVLFGSETRRVLYLSDMVEGTYLFQLRVTDAQGRVSTATATVEVRPGRPPLSAGSAGVLRVNGPLGWFVQNQAAASRWSWRC